MFYENENTNGNKESNLKYLTEEEVKIIFTNMINNLSTSSNFKVKNMIEILNTIGCCIGEIKTINSRCSLNRKDENSIAAQKYIELIHEQLEYMYKELGYVMPHYFGRFEEN